MISALLKHACPLDDPASFVFCYLLSDYLKCLLSNSSAMLRNSCLYMFTLRGDGVLRTSVTLIKCLCCVTEGVLTARLFDAAGMNGC